MVFGIVREQIPNSPCLILRRRSMLGWLVTVCFYAAALVRGLVGRVLPKGLVLFRILFIPPLPRPRAAGRRPRTARSKMASSFRRAWVCFRALVALGSGSRSYLLPG